MERQFLTYRFGQRSCLVVLWAFTAGVQTKITKRNALNYENINAGLILVLLTSCLKQLELADLGRVEYRRM
jgi:hypothetical protein